MRTIAKASRAAKSPIQPKDVAKRIANRAPFDRGKSHRSCQRATEAADRLLKEMGDVLKQLDRKR